MKQLGMSYISLIRIQIGKLVFEINWVVESYHTVDGLMDGIKKLWSKDRGGHDGKQK